MSQKNKKRVSASQSSQVKGAKVQDVEMDSDEDVSLTQPSSTQLQRSLARLTPAQVDRKMAEVVQFILIKDQKKVPIKRADIVKHVVKEYKNIYNEIMKRVSKTFEQVFGLKLVEIDVKHHCYILINKLEHVEDDNLSLGGSPKTGLLLVILGIIFMRGGVVKECKYNVPGHSFVFLARNPKLYKHIHYVEFKWAALKETHKRCLLALPSFHMCLQGENVLLAAKHVSHQGKQLIGYLQVGSP
ncbi:necdin-like 2 isoform X1 [Polyodon spathula]|uniref:necdin-like 2 isoform X1 n=1 Tax=Polyodon spathula TaxID=7913 RepID=UPI001B7EE583|nr:necdin-like 2 isoform X1 [Polyodon spathula]